ncbi:MAG: hypothetical protein ACP5OB_05005 [Candidatus Ratteibacteria bacterium]
MILPTIKIFLPEVQSEEIKKIIQTINEAEKKSTSEKKTVYFYFNLDEDTYWFKSDKDNAEMTEINNSSLDFYRARNEFEERNNGIIFFRIYPEGKKDFFVLYLYDNEKKQTYTLYFNPFSDIKIYNEELNEEEF